MRRFTSNFVLIRGYGTALACLTALGCGGDSGTQTPPATGTGTGGGAPMGVASGAGGTPTGTGGRATTAGTGSGTTAGRGTATGGTGAAPTAGAGTATGGTGTAGMAAAAAGTGATPMPAGQPGSASVLQYHGNAARDGHYVDAAFTRAAAAMLKKDTTFMDATSGTMTAQPLYVEAGAGGKDVIITATANNDVTALDAATGATVWKTSLGPVQSGAGCSFDPKTIGVVGTPAVDPATKTLYVAAMVSGPKHQVFALGLEDGNVKTGWPADVGKVSAGGVTFNTAAQNQRGALLIVGDMVYVPYGGFNGDCNDYHGWVVGVPLTNPAAPIGFATKANAGGIWAPGGLASDGTSVYAATGNTMSGPLVGFSFTTPATWGHGNAILKLSKDLKTIAESDTTNFYAARNWKEFDMGDLDLGSSNPVLVSVPGATPSDLVLAFGKSGDAFLLDRANLGGMGGHIATAKVSGSGLGGGVIIAPAAYTTPTGTFVVFRGTQTTMGCAMGMGNIGALKIEASSPPKISVGWCAGPNGNGSPMVTTTDGKSDSIVWYLGSGKLIGLNGETGMQVYGGGGAMDGTGTTAKWQTPIVAKGRIFVGTNSGVVAYTLK